MNDLEAQLAKVVEKSLEVAERTGEFVIEQAPELLREFYMWHTAKHIMDTGLFLTIFVVGCVIIYKMWNNEDAAAQVISIFFGGFMVVSMIFLWESVHDLILITVAPKAYLV